MSSSDAHRLAEIASRKQTPLVETFVRTLAKVTAGAGLFGVAISGAIYREPMSFGEAHLSNLGVVTKREGKWELSVIGEAFIKSVSDPSIEEN